MVTYLLLRDNKQSGPYVLDELKTKGLKAYDLVWIEGKSAAWRYPCEIEELKPFSPVVEEQPFDRFYKKPVQNPVQATTQIPELPSKQIPVLSSVQTPVQSTVQTISVSENIPARAVAATVKEDSRIAATYPTLITGESSTVPGKRIIYVTLPSGNGSSGSLRRESTQSNAQTNQQTNPQAPSQTTLRTELQSSPEPSEAFSSNYTENNIDAETLVSGHYTAKHFNNPRSGSRTFLRSFGIAICVLALLAAGVFIGLYIDKDKLLDFTHKPAGKDLSVNAVPQLADNTPATSANTASNGPSATAPATVPGTNAGGAAPLSTPTTANSTISNITNNQVRVTDSKPVATLSAGSGGNTTTPAKNSGNPAQNEGSLPDKLAKKTVLSKEKEKTAESNNPVTPVAPAPLKDSQNQVASHREAIHRTPDASSVEKENFRNNVANLVSVSSNTYNVGTFGGISDLQLTVSNRSAYPLDLVVVEIQYVQANKKVYKTESLNFHDIRAGSALMLEAPKTARGIKVQYKITYINSKESGLSYSAI